MKAKGKRKGQGKLLGFEISASLTALEFMIDNSLANYEANRESYWDKPGKIMTFEYYLRSHFIAFTKLSHENELPTIGLHYPKAIEEFKRLKLTDSAALLGLYKFKQPKINGEGI